MQRARGSGGRVSLLTGVCTLVAGGLFIAGCGGGIGGGVTMKAGGSAPRAAQSRPGVALDGKGGGLSVWNDGRRIVARMFVEDSGGWQEEETVATGTAHFRLPEVAMSAAGSAVVVWQQGLGGWRITYEPQGGWDEQASRLSDGKRSEGRGDVSEGAEPIAAADTLGTSGKLLTIHRDEKLSLQEGTTQAPYFYMSTAVNERVPGGGWGDFPYNVDKNNDESMTPRSVHGFRAAYGGSGTGLIVWSQQNPDPADPKEAVFAAFSPPRSGGGGMPDRLALGVAVREPDVGLDADGNAFVVYVADGDVHARRFDVADGAWEAAVPLEDDLPGTATGPRVAVNGPGSAIAIWVPEEGGVIWTARYRPGIGWSAGQSIEAFPGGTASTGNRPGDLHVGMDGKGGGRAVWAARGGIWTSRYDGSWGAAEEIGRGTAVDLAVDPAGRAIAVWWDEEFRSRVWLPSDDSRILFATDRKGDFEICSMRPDGTGMELLTSDDADDLDPVWSPDRSRIAWVSNRDAPPFFPAGTDLYVKEIATGAVTRMTPFSGDGASVVDPSWSPDGTEIVCAIEGVGMNGIFVTDVATMTRRILTVVVGSRRPAWSPDGRRIAFDRQGDLFFLDPALDAAQTPEQLTKGATAESAPAWSPDGEELLFATAGAGIFRMDLATKMATLLTNGADDASPAWSPEMKAVLFVRAGAIWTMDDEGADPQEIASQEGTNIDPDWR